MVIELLACVLLVSLTQCPSPCSHNLQASIRVSGQMVSGKLSPPNVTFTLTHSLIRTDTQSTLFTGQNVERLIEIGPANTLATMAKRTLADPMYADWDTAMSISRQVLSCKSNHDDIYHVRESGGASTNSTKPIDTQAAVSNTKPPSPPRADDHPAVAPPAVQLMGQQENVLAAEILPDEPITARQILTFLVAHKLKKKPSDILGSSTIKSLVQG